MKDLSMNFINCTPHAITICLPEWVGGNQTTYPPSGAVPRCATVRTEVALTGPYRTVKQTLGAVTGLPDAVPGVALIVSAMVLAALGGTRPDVFAPDTGPDAIRENGQIVAVRGLVQ